MYIDYLTVMLMNMVAGLLLLAGYLVWGVNRQNGKIWAPAFGAVGFVALVTGLHMSLTWPLIGGAKWANIAFGEPTVLLGATFSAAAVCLVRGWSLRGVGFYGAIAGVVSIAVGAAIGSLALTKSPTLSSMGFIMTGAGAIGTALCIFLPKKLAIRVLVSVVLLVAAGIWALIGLGAYVSHIERFSQGG